MANASDNKPHWKAYILGPFTGVPKLIGGLKRDDSTAAFHGAQATVWGLVFLLGLGVLSVGLHFALPYLGNVMGMRGLLLSILVWLCYYLWIGGGLWVYIVCLVTVKSGGWAVSKPLTQSALWLEGTVASWMKK